MSQQLFAFRLAKPAEYSADEVQEGEYDPQTQTTVWEGDNRPLGITCSKFVLGGRIYCKTYNGSRCCLSGPRYTFGKDCDWCVICRC